MASKKKGAKAEAKSAAVAKPLPPVSPEERKRIINSYVAELNARPDAREQIVRDSIPALSRILGGHIPQLDMGVREEASPPAPGPMTRNRLVDPKDLVNADAGQNVKVGAPAGGQEAQDILTVGKAVNDAAEKKPKKKPSAGAAKKKGASKKK